MRTIELSDEALERMKSHARKAYPDECCGALFGHELQERRRVVAVMEIENVSDENRRRRFSIDPRDYIRAEQHAEEMGLLLLGFYHSHPDHPARPSETDRKFAQPGFSYPILSIISGEFSEMTSWYLPEGDEWYQQENVITGITEISQGEGNNYERVW